MHEMRGPPGHPLIFLAGLGAFGLGVISFCFNSKGDNILSHKQENEQTKWEKLEVRTELSKISLLGLLANENHCNFYIESNTVVVLWLKIIEQL